MTTYDHNRYSPLGNGEPVTLDCYKIVDGQPHPVPVSSQEIGTIAGNDNDVEYVRAIPARGPVIDLPTEAPALLDTLAASLGLKTPIGRKALAIALQNVQVLDQKNQDYSPANIAEFGEYGVLVRVSDKYQRLKNLLTNVKEPKNESVEDSWLDLSNYAIIAVLCRRGEWR